jgi:hypothetical protein
MQHNQFLIKKVNGGLQMQKGINLEDQNRAIVKLRGLKLSN